MCHGSSQVETRDRAVTRRDILGGYDYRIRCTTVQGAARSEYKLGAVYRDTPHYYPNGVYPMFILMSDKEYNRLVKRLYSLRTSYEHAQRCNDDHALVLKSLLDSVRESLFNLA